eukprot:3243138-Prymnesium_polylepis.1
MTSLHCNARVAHKHSSVQPRRTRACDDASRHPRAACATAAQARSPAARNACDRRFVHNAAT